MAPSLPSNLANHPRYGKSIRRSLEKVSEEELRNSYWDYRDATFFPESAIVANMSEQVYASGMYGRPYYVDLLKTCTDCERPFLFFAEEQKHWYEELKLHVDAGCVRCAECRKHDQSDRLRFNRYSRLIVQSFLNDEDLVQLVDDAIELWKADVLKNEANFRRLKNRIQRQLPDHAKTAEIIRWIKQLDSN